MFWCLSWPAIFARIYLHYRAIRSYIQSKVAEALLPGPSTIVFHFGRPLTSICFYSSQPAKTSYCLYAPDLLYKPILTAYPYLNRPTRASVLSGYTDSVVDKVLILPPRQVHQELEPSKGVRSLESSVAAIVYYAPQPLPAALCYL